MEDTYKIEYTLEEMQELVALLDIAVKAGGLQMASLAVKHFQKLEQARTVE